MNNHVYLIFALTFISCISFGQSNVGINRIPQSTLDIMPIPDGFNFGNAIARLSDTTGIHFMTLRSGSTSFPGTGIIWNTTSAFTLGNPIDRISILSDGKVGMNRTVPHTNLHIQAPDSAPARLRLSDNNELKELTLSSGSAPNENPYIQWSGSDTLRFGTGVINSLEEKMSIAQNGNVHIEGMIQSDSLSGASTRPAMIDPLGTIRPGSNVAFHVIQTFLLDTVEFASESILFDSIVVDNTHSYTHQNPPIPFSYYTIPEDGLYFLTCSVTHRANTRLSVYIQRKPVGELEQALAWGHGLPDPNTLFRNTITVSTLAYLSSGDQLRVKASEPLTAIITANSTSFTGYKLW